MVCVYNTNFTAIRSRAIKEGFKGSKDTTNYGF